MIKRFILAAVLGVLSMGTAYAGYVNCTTTCYTVGNQRVCNTSCY